MQENLVSSKWQIITSLIEAEKCRYDNFFSCLIDHILEHKNYSYVNKNPEKNSYFQDNESRGPNIKTALTSIYHVMEVGSIPCFKASSKSAMPSDILPKEQSPLSVIL